MRDIVDLTAYIDLPTRTQPIVEALDRAVQRRRICTLIGPSGSGKSALIDHWVRTRPAKPFSSDEVLLVRLRPSGSIPMNCILYSRLWHEILKRNRPRYTPANVTAEDDIKIYNERQLQSLHLKVLEHLEKLHIRAIIVDNGHLLDQLALEWSLDLRTFYDERQGFLPRRALVLLGQAKPTELRNNPLVRMLAKNDEACAAWTEKLEVTTLNDTEFAHVLGWLTLRNLGATFAPDVKLQGESMELLKIINGNWYHVARLADVLDEELGPGGNNENRVITREVLARVKQRFQN